MVHSHSLLSPPLWGRGNLLHQLISPPGVPPDPRAQWPALGALLGRRAEVGVTVIWLTQHIGPA